jgi:O-succinylbenzoic acid--CoA ligase
MLFQFLTNNTEIIDQVNDFIEEWNNSNNFIYTYTSGSTGAPKRIEILKKHMIVSAKSTAAFLGLKEGQRSLLVLSPQTIGGKMMIVRSIVLGLTLYVGEVSANPMHELTQHFDFVAMVPMQLKRVLSQTPDKISQINQLIIGGGPMSNELVNAVQGLPVRVFHTFGMTETISHIALKSINHPCTDSYELLQGVSISSDHGKLTIDWPAIGVKELKTNDVVTIDNNSFVWHGRSDFVINSGGIKLHPEIIEAKLASIIHSSFFCTGLPDSELGEKHVLCIEGEEIVFQKSDFISLLDKYEVPKEIIFVKTFAYTKSGKINRVETLKTLAHGTRKVL